MQYDCSTGFANVLTTESGEAYNAILEELNHNSPVINPFSILVAVLRSTITSIEATLVQWETSRHNAVSSRGSYARVDGSIGTLENRSS